MKKYRSLIIFLALLVIVGGAALAYPALSERFEKSGSQNGGSTNSNIDGNNPASTNSVDANTGNHTTGSTNSKDSAGDPDAIPAIDFPMQDYQGNTVNLSDYYGKPIVLNFWASWCPPCKAEMPIFNEIYKDVKDDVMFIMLDLIGSRGETVAAGKAFIEDNGYSFPVFFDMEGKGGSYYRIQSIPTTYFIDKNGNLVTYHMGGMNAIQLQTGIDMIR